MSAGRTHLDEVHTDVSLAGRLIAAQFPQWADLPIEPVHSAGTDNAIYRLGDDMAVRLPRIRGAAGQVDKEHRWLPRLAPLLPLAIPVPLGKGRPAEDYPWSWSVYRWLDGENATVERIADPRHAATELGHFVAALQRAPASQGAPVWIHGDLLPGNLLARRGRLSAVIDFGCLGVGDPACDVMAAWTFVSAESREVFRAAVGVDDATWARGRGWALSFGLIALPYYRVSNPVLAHIARRAIDEAITDQRTA